MIITDKKVLLHGIDNYIGEYVQCTIDSVDHGRIKLSPQMYHLKRSYPHWFQQFHLW